MRATTSRCRWVIATMSVAYMGRTLFERAAPTIDQRVYFARLRRYSRPADEARLVPARVRLVQFLLIERPDPEQQLELVAEVRSHHLRAVGGDREAHAALDERAERAPHRRLVRERLRQQVRGRADLEHYPALL